MDKIKNQKAKNNPEYTCVAEKWWYINNSLFSSIDSDFIPTDSEDQSTEIINNRSASKGK